MILVKYSKLFFFPKLSNSKFFQDSRFSGHNVNNLAKHNNKKFNKVLVSKENIKYFILKRTWTLLQLVLKMYIFIRYSKFNSFLKTYTYSVRSFSYGKHKIKPKLNTQLIIT